MNPQQSSSYPPEKGNTNWSNDQQSAPYNPATYGRAPSPLPQDRAEEGTLVLVDENGNQVGALGEHINVAGVVPGSQGLFPTLSRAHYSMLEHTLTTLKQILWRLILVEPMASSLFVTHILIPLVDKTFRTTYCMDYATFGFFAFSYIVIVLNVFVF